MALRGAKADMLASLDVDIAVVPECARSDAESFAESHRSALVWADGREGDDWPHKGLGVFARPGLRLSLSNSYDANIKVILPVVVSGDEDLNLLAVWTQPP